MEILVPALILCVDNILENVAAVKLLAGQPSSNYLRVLATLTPSWHRLAVESTLVVRSDKNSLSSPHTSPPPNVLAAQFVIFALSFSFDHNVNICTEPISPGDWLPFTLRNSFRKLLMLNHKGLVPQISMYVRFLNIPLIFTGLS